MLYSKVNGQKWKQTVLRKLISYLEKCPVLLSMETGTKNNEDGVYIIHKGSNAKYFFTFDPSIEEKAFIHQIKKFLVEKHYPRLIEPITESRNLSPEDIAKQIEQGVEPSQVKKVELKEIGYRQYRIDKSIVWKSIFILELEDVVHHDGRCITIVPTTLRYKLNTSATVFLKKYRSGGFASIEEASKYFFDNAIIIDELNSAD